ncbi:hypothetical protein [uncultured Chryseobacterium sp.]|uniref:hypothetical protein n=1 Tax=uncultured Chryseobacterium sp. TaxID=259322 RepID=UPI00258C60A5|nr:hypothetical protein [uncultured Chryseobacterium sp.]
MVGQINNGVAKIELAPVASDGGMGTVFKKLGETMLGTLKINMEDGTTTDFNVEEFDEPIFTRTTKGAMSFDFDVANPDADTLVEVGAGSKDANGNYIPPIGSVTVERSLKITPEIGFGFNVVRTLITYKFTTDMGKDNLLGVSVNAKVLRPTKENTPSFELVKYPITTP